MAGSAALVVCYLLIGLLVGQLMWTFGSEDDVLFAIVMDAAISVVVLVSLLHAPHIARRAVGSHDVAIWACLTAVVWFVGVLCATRLSLDFPTPSFDEYSSTMASSNPRLVILLSLVFAPVSEELMMRRLVYRYLRDVGGIFAMLVSSSLFALMHGTLVHLPFTFLLGCLLCLVLERTGDVRACMVTHACANALSLFVAPKVALTDWALSHVVCWGAFAFLFALVVRFFVMCFADAGPETEPVSELLSGGDADEVL